ncbi:MAG: type II toxin-antitoxin system prevent-host-death family antitoxin [Candidatus Neomarinimicrobiota bacterium]
MKRVPLSEMKDHLSEYLRAAGQDEIIITRHGKPAGVFKGFDTEDDWIDYRLENDPRFLARVAAARSSIQAGKGIRLEDIPE